MAGISTSVVEVGKPSVIGAVAGLASRQARASWVGSCRRATTAWSWRHSFLALHSINLSTCSRRPASLSISWCFVGLSYRLFSFFSLCSPPATNRPPSERPPNMSQHALSDQQVRNLTTKPHIIPFPSSIGHALLTCLRSPASRSTMSSAR